MLPPCFRLAERVFPLVRLEAAHRLAEAGHAQAEIGRRLGVSQAMVSKYLKAGPPTLREQDEWIVRQMAEEITHAHAHEATEAAGHGSEEPANPWCRALALTTGEHQEHRRRVVADLLAVLQRIRETPVAPLVPNVGMNLAGALPEARERNDVAAFPGRLAWVQGSVRAHAPPEFGASNHLARLLIHAQRERSEVRFVVNLAGTPDAVKAAKRTEDPILRPTAARRDEAGVARFKAPHTAFALHDAGGFGIEPALYLVDRDANALADRLIRLAQATGGR